MKRLLIHLPILFLSWTSLAATCNSLFALEKSAHDWWSRKAPQMVGGQPLTYSTDTEFDFVDNFKILRTSEKAYKLGTANLRKEDIPAKILAKALKMSEKVFRSKCLASGVSKAKKTYFISELKPEFAGAVYHEYIEGRRHSFLYDEGFRPIWNDEERVEGVDQVLKQKGIPMYSDIDGYSIEIRHKTYDLVPDVFYKNMDRLTSLADAPMSHLHLGIPESVPNNKVLALGKIIESVIVLRMISDFDDPSSLEIKFLGSTINSNNNIAKVDGAETMRGFVKIAFKSPEFKIENVKYSDLEVRQYNYDIEEKGVQKIEDGLTLLSLAGVLAQNYKNVIEIEPLTVSSTVGSHFDTFAFLAAKHISLLLQKRSDPELKRLGKKLDNQVSLKTFSANSLKQFIQDNDLIEKLYDVNTYLEHSSGIPE